MNKEKKWNDRIIQMVQQDTRKSYSTRAGRIEQLKHLGKTLRENGYNVSDPRNLKPKHVESALRTWQKKELTSGTLKNRMSNLRWLTEQIGKGDMIQSKNTDLGIENRVYLDNSINKAFDLKSEHLVKVDDMHLRLSLELQRAFGLRREESMKIRPFKADKGDRIHLQASWCKGGRERDIPIRTEEQRAILEAVKNSIIKTTGKNGSLIPKNRDYNDQMELYKAQTRAAEINGHGIRHQYAQQLYKNMTGLDCPKAGGPTWKQLTTQEQRDIVTLARQTVAIELGHGREIIANNYLGR